ncbi:glycosyltransferase family 39 protein [Curtobacterium sp. MCSS17_007]|uniref:ArnT family glycosyltransferase n=1 Tax=Curtobacterium sp. MCSS17_007 TaxID=2175646 RepID=UPI0011B84806|nr:glycosyltransferase family 39 protein [Curtobacterium sp. MCSS17_007]WIE74990.1 glycosyltransferase family 39 protein [Curtobacterium sp. MCSS17_007]
MPRRPWSLTADPRVRAVAFLILAVWGVYQCTWNLLGANVTGDEAIYVRSGWAYVHGDLSTNREHPPFAKYLFGAAQLVFGQGVLGPRIVVAVLVLAAGAAVFLWLRVHIGFWAGLTAAALWLLTPRDGAGSGARLDRLALLDPVMAVFALLALGAGWAWVRSGRWWLVPVSATLMAMSVTSKVSTVVLLPAFLVLPLLHRDVRRLVVGGLVWAGTFGLVFVLLYLPMGIRSAITYMIDFQDGQNTNGHPISIDGHVFTFAPWWADLRFFGDGVGAVMVVVIVVGLVAAFVVRPDRLVAYLGTALGLLVVFYVVVARIALPTYYEAWMPLTLLLTAIGYARLASLRPRVWWSSLATVLVLLSVVPAARVSLVAWTERPTGIARVDGWLRSQGIDGGQVLFVSATPTLYDPYFLGRGTMDPDAGPFVAVVVGNDVRFPAPGAVATFLQQDRGSLRTTDLDGLRVYAPEDGEIRNEGGVLGLTR